MKILLDIEIYLKNCIYIQRSWYVFSCNAPIIHLHTLDVYHIGKVNSVLRSVEEERDQLTGGHFLKK